MHKNPARPFLVFTSQVVTTVLGTSFDVKAYPGSPQALVAVREGKVSVQPRQAAELDATPTHPAKAGVLLLPNQQVVYSVASHQLKKELVDKQAITVSVLNALGQNMLSQTLPAGADAVRTLALPGLAKGLYTLRLETTAGVVAKRLAID